MKKSGTLGRTVSESVVAAKNQVVDSGAMVTDMIAKIAASGAKCVSTTVTIPVRKVSDVLERTSRMKRSAKEVEGYIIVEDMPDDIKLCYLNVLVWLMYFDDRQIDEREVCEIQVLMTQLRCNAELRQAIRANINSPGSLNAEAQITQMLALTPSGTQLALRCSLVKDAIRLHRATSAGNAREQMGIHHLAGLLDIDDEKVAFIEEACTQDEKILTGEMSDDQITAAAKGLAAKASAVGVPVAAVYLSGSVTGLSAAGITSGLSALGLGGVLGLSAMVTGIGVAIIGGIGVYKGLQWAMGSSKRNRASRRELMLQEVLHIHQKAIANLAEDISFFAGRLVVLTVKVDKNQVIIDKLSREITVFAESLARLRQRESSLELDLEAETQRRTV